MTKKEKISESNDYNRFFATVSPIKAKLISWKRPVRKAESFKLPKIKALTELHYLGKSNKDKSMN